MSSLRRRRVVVALVLSLTAAVAPAAGAGAPSLERASDATRHQPEPPLEAVTGRASTHRVTTDAESRRSTAADGGLHLMTTLALTPDRRGRVRARFTFQIPDRVVSLRARLPSDATLVSVEGFSIDDGEYVWDEETATPTITVSLPANQTAVEGGPLAADGDYLFVDTGPWAIVRNPPVSVRWSRVGDRPVTFSQSLAVDGEGAAGRSIAYLGPAKTVTHTAHEQTFRLVVPAAAELAETPAAIVRSLASASGRLHVGDRDPQVFVVAAPTTVKWAVRGLSVGDAGLWVRASERLDEPGNVWLHEYVHTRQAFATTSSGRWFTEASATWYAAYLTLEQGRIGFDTFARYLRLGSTGPRADAILAQPSTWAGHANYYKGALVLGELDRRIRLATDHGRSLQAAVRRLNGQRAPVENEDVVAAIGAVSTSEIAAAAERFTTTRAAPEMWNRTAHERAFGPTPAVFDVHVASEIRIVGPYRNVSVAPPVTLVVGETLAVPVTVTNVGGTVGSYELTMDVGNATVANRSGRLQPGESTTVVLTAAVEQVGEYVVTVAGTQFRISVRTPAKPRVVDVLVEQATVRPNEAVSVAVRVRNPTAVPAVGNVTVTRDGAVVARRRVVLAPGANRTLTVPVRFPSVGTYHVAAGDASLTVTVRRKETDEPTVTATPDTGTEETRTSAPGVGPAGAALAVLLAALLARRTAR